MLLTHLELQNFRNFSHALFDFHQILTVIIGENAKGKTSLLEAVYFFVTGYGFREAKEEELLLLGEYFAFVQGQYDDQGRKKDFKIVLVKENNRTKKDFFIEKAKKGYTSYQKDQIKAVLFSPGQISIIDGAPSLRREYFNRVISIADLEYKKKLLNYEHALRRRNKILERNFGTASFFDEIEYWDKYLIEQAGYITKKRKEYVDFLNIHQSVDGKLFSIRYLNNEFSKDRLVTYRDIEIKAKKTLIGPQRDDFQISLVADREEKNIHHFGSRSEQRLAVFWLKINELLYYETMFRRKPILLLDDVFSELDLHNKKLILHLIGKYQTVITTTEEEMMQEIKEKHSLIRL